jgi:5-methylcytosine-specific restriction endonuclease McrA
MAPKRQHVCSRPGCPSLIPCPRHGRKPGANWTANRTPDRAAQARFRKAVLERDNYTCTRCGHHDPTGRDLHAHHVRPGYTLDCGQTACIPCHVAIDSSARDTRHA